jgi:DNA polymerase I
MKLAMVKIAAKLPADTQILLQVHDSLIVEAPKEKAEAVGQIMKQTMETVYELPVKLKTDVSIGKNWGEL